MMLGYGGYFVKIGFGISFGFWKLQNGYFWVFCFVLWKKYRLS